MPGLLDWTEQDWESPRGQGLLSAAFSLLAAQKMPGQSGGGAFANALGQAGQTYLQSSGAAKRNAIQEKLLGAQVAEAEHQVAERKRKQAMDEQITQLATKYQRPPQPARPGTADLQSMMPQGTSIGAMQPIPAQQGGFDTQGFLGALPSVQGMNPLKAIETQAKYQQMLAKERPKYSTSPQFTQQGRAYLVGEDGSIKWLDGQVAPRDKVISEDMGGKRIYRTEYSPNQIGEAEKTLSKDTLYSGGITMRGQNMVNQRAIDANALKRGELQMEGGGPSQANLTFKFGKPQPGYRWTQDGGLEAIPGGPADIKARTDIEKKASGGNDVSVAIGTLRDAYDRLEKGGGITSTEKSVLSNLKAAGSSSAVGQIAGRALGTANQSARNDVAMARPALLAALMKATGMSAKQMDSNAELKLWLSTATDPTLDVESNRRALDNIERKYLGVATGGWGEPSTTPPSADGWSGQVIPPKGR